MLFVLRCQRTTITRPSRGICSIAQLAFNCDFGGKQPFSNWQKRPFGPVCAGSAAVGDSALAPSRARVVCRLARKPMSGLNSCGHAGKREGQARMPTRSRNGRGPAASRGGPGAHRQPAARGHGRDARAGPAVLQHPQPEGRGADVRRLGGHDPAALRGGVPRREGRSGRGRGPRGAHPGPRRLDPRLVLFSQDAGPRVRLFATHGADRSGGWAGPDGQHPSPADRQDRRGVGGP